MKLKLALASALALTSMVVAAQGAPAPAAKPTMPAVCGTCHKPAPNQVSGYFDNVAFKTTSIQLNLGTAVEIIRFDPKTLKVVDAGTAKTPEFLREVKKGHEARIEYVEKDGTKLATSISFKGPIKIAQEKLIFYPEIAKLVEIGPEQGKFTLIDSRPLPRFQEGTIPGSINLPYPAWDKFVSRLPADKDKLLVFYCQGVTCMMSPNSLIKAEALGYRNVKVYREGWPEWTEKNVGVLAPVFLKDAWLDKDIPHVLIDARPAVADARGHIKGSVNIPPEKIKDALKSFPDKKLKPPFMVYDQGDGKAAMEVARQITAAGYPNVVVLPGGYDAWVKAGYPTVAGVPVTQVAYAPKPRPGSLPADEFTSLAKNTPANVLILDVRNQDEANAGMIKGAILIPDEDLAARMKEVPKDKRIVTHCATGVRAEMAYHKLKAAGYNVNFLNADIEIARDGSFKLTPRM
jgi:rhodanese-related sulfurtransferase